MLKKYRGWGLFGSGVPGAFAPRDVAAQHSTGSCKGALFRVWLNACWLPTSSAGAECILSWLRHIQWQVSIRLNGASDQWLDEQPRVRCTAALTTPGLMECLALLHTNPQRPE